MASPELYRLRSTLMDVLKDFDTINLDEFKFYIRDPDLLQEFIVIRKHQLETTQRGEIMTAILDHYGIFSIDVVKVVLEQMNQNRLVKELSTRCPYKHKEVLAKCMVNLKCDLRELFEFLSEGVGASGGSSDKSSFELKRRVELNEGYIEIFITKGGSEVYEKHEVSQMERDSRRSSQEQTVLCQDIFKDPPGQGPIRVVLTKGVAGVGKTVLTQKFSLDWAEDRINQEIQLLFPFTFRNLNQIGDSYSLVEFLHKRFSKTKELFSFQQLKLLFILDGLDEFRHPLDFRKTRVVTDPTEKASVEELLVNLIRGDLCPTAHIWITTRPAAANQIPEEYVSMVTEVRGFTDEQKDQFFMKKFKGKATDIIKHIKKNRSLYIMCHIAVFCWILSDVLQHLLPTGTAELPSTLTQMYIHFLVLQAKVQNKKYEGKQGSDDPWIPETITRIWSLAKLAFEQLMKGKLIFYKNDLIQCGLDAEDIARYSVFKEILKTEPGEGDIKVYCFIHLSFQEFLAALHVHHIFFSTGVNLLLSLPSSENPGSSTATLLSSVFQMFRINDSTESFYRCAVDLALQSPTGHLDLFVRFLLGLSLSTNQELLQGLLMQTGSDNTNQKTIKYLRQKLNEDCVSSEQKLNLLHCLNELNDQSLLEEIQKVLKDKEFSGRHMSPAEWSAMSFILLSSDTDLEEFDLKKYQRSEEALLGLRPLIKVSTKAILTCCNLTENICAPLASVLSSSSLKHLDLSNNDLKDSGVELLCQGLKSAPCSLETLRLSGCMISERGGTSLAATLSSAFSGLREFDLSYNHLRASADLLKKLQAPQGPLQTLRLDPSGDKFLLPGLRKYACEVFLDPNTVHRKLVLSEDLRSVRLVEEKQWKSYPDHEDRFTRWTQVLGSSGLRGRCYWEVDWKIVKKWVGLVHISVSYRRIMRRRDSEWGIFGNNNHSWSLGIYYAGKCSVEHNGMETDLPGRVGVPLALTSGRKGRVGVFLDWEGGALSFYDIISKGRSSHLHTFNCSFTEELLPGFGLFWEGESLSIVDLNKD